MSRRIRVLVADDSVTARSALVELLGAEADLEVVGEAADGLEVLRLTETLAPDVVTMDVQMPRMNGLEAIQRLMATHPVRIVVICALGNDALVDLSLRATALGALEVLPKPSGTEDLRSWGRKAAATVRLMASIPVVTRHRPALARGAGRELAAIAIAASTGGPAALVEILRALPASFPVPLLVAQHMARGFTAGLVRWLAASSRLTVRAAASGERPAPGHVYVAPDGTDLEVDASGVLLVTPNPGDLCPSGDRLLRSVAATFGRRAAGLVLTGMGADGAAGLLAIRDVGGLTWAQDEQSSVVYGMPAAAVRAGAVQQQLALDAIAPTLRLVCQSVPPPRSSP
ncbi:MAG: chemotaxis-specific protein-glutamate methyltransferase CheB [Myxococcota bacterium]